MRLGKVSTYNQCPVNLSKVMGRLEVSRAQSADPVETLCQLAATLARERSGFVLTNREVAGDAIGLLQLAARVRLATKQRKARKADRAAMREIARRYGASVVENCGEDRASIGLLFNSRAYTCERTRAFVVA